MAFFDDLGRRISQAGQGAIKKTRNVADTVRINADISDQERAVNNLYNQIGRAYFSIHGSEPDERLKELVYSVKETNKRIEELKKQLSSMNDTCGCARCGAMNPEGSLFCTVCGARLEAEERPAQVFCTNCGRMISEGTVFCNYCGFEQKEVKQDPAEPEAQPSAAAEPESAAEPENVEVPESAAEQDKTITDDDTKPESGEASAVFCKACGAKAEQGALFCTVCGKKLAE